MPVLHDPTTRSLIESRLGRLAPSSRRRWGSMTVDQMLRHVNSSFELSLARRAAAPQRRWVPGWLIKPMVLHLPWPRGAPSNAATHAAGTYDFESERRTTLALIDEFMRQDLDSTWPDQPLCGAMRGIDWSRLHARHLDHHLRQFGV